MLYVLLIPVFISLSLPLLADIDPGIPEITELPLSSAADQLPVEMSLPSPDLSPWDRTERASDDLSLSPRACVETLPGIQVARADTAECLAIGGLLMLPFDDAIMEAIPNVSPGEKCDSITQMASRFGEWPILLGSIAGMYFLGSDRDKDTAKMALTAFLSAGLVTHGVKTASGRTRPCVEENPGRFHGPTTATAHNSFPSGHTSVAFAVATVLADRHPGQRSVYYGLAVAVGLSRIRKTAHHPSDVLVGAGIGIIAGESSLAAGPTVSLRF